MGAQPIIIFSNERSNEQWGRPYGFDDRENPSG